MNYITIAEKTSEKHRKSIIIHDGLWYVAEFDTVDQLDFFAKTLGFTYTFREQKQFRDEGTIRRYDMDRTIKDHRPGGFRKLSDVPEDARPIKALSNGRIVTCYFVNDGENITVYRPNPNAPEVYKPISPEDCVAHKRIYGTF